MNRIERGTEEEEEQKGDTEEAEGKKQKKLRSKCGGKNVKSKPNVSKNSHNSSQALRAINDHLGAWGDTSFAAITFWFLFLFASLRFSFYFVLSIPQFLFSNTYSSFAFFLLNRRLRFTFSVRVAFYIPIENFCHLPRIRMLSRNEIKWSGNG